MIDRMTSLHASLLSIKLSSSTWGNRFAGVALRKGQQRLVSELVWALPLDAQLSRGDPFTHDQFNGHDNLVARRVAQALAVDQEIPHILAPGPAYRAPLAEKSP